ncbi:MAG: twin-arginine translocase subunit TatC [Verrucomicrobiales bacterium]|nr:twin-arginine translocase subunit TatC [Verrucomicrobiales bacterium]
MADSPEEPLLDEEQEEGGGPVKSFLEHLEDLRWVLIKVVASVLIAMTACLFGAGYMVKFLKAPLEEMRRFKPRAEHQITVWFGTNLLETFYVETNVVGSLRLGTNKAVALGLRPVSVDGHQVLALDALAEAPGEVPAGPGPKLIFLDPVAPFLSSLKIAFFGGLVVAAPFVLLFIGQFVAPALKIKEKKYFSQALFFGIGLFLLGAAFCYFVMVPVALRTAEAYSFWMGVSVVDWRAETYFSLVVMFMLAMGLGFELPVVLLALVKIGILDYPTLAAGRKYSIVICVTVAALLTPPDVITQILMAIPLQILYEITVWIAWYWHRRDKKRAALEEAAS